MNAEDLFSHFFGGMSGMGGGMGGGPFGGMFGQQAQREGPIIHHAHRVSLEDIYRGKTSKLRLEKTVICPKCAGHGAKESDVQRCRSCNGAGYREGLRQIGPIIQRQRVKCQQCDGQGRFIEERNRCKQCGGERTIVEKKILHVNVDRGVANGTQIKFPGEGDQHPDRPTGDVLFTIEQKPHPRFQRKENDLYYVAEIDLVTALAGGTIYIEHLDDRWLEEEILPSDLIRPGESRPNTRRNNQAYPLRVRQGDQGPRHARTATPQFW